MQHFSLSRIKSNSFHDDPYFSKGLEYFVYEFIDKVYDRLTEEERLAVKEEMQLIEKHPATGNTLHDAMAIAASRRDKLPYDVERVLTRIHEISGTGTLASNQSSLPIVDALYDLDLVGLSCESKHDVYVGRGHIAPAFYAHEYVQGHLPFSLLATMHLAFTGVINSQWGFANTMGYSLGLGVAQSVSKALFNLNADNGRSVVNLAGDGELNEGVTYECLKYASDIGLKNYVLLVDANGKGIENLEKPLATKNLEGLFTNVAEVDANNADDLKNLIKASIHSGDSTAIVCRTEKGSHGFKLPTAVPVKKFSAKTGATLKAFADKHQRNVFAVTADMAGRFGLSGELAYTNVSLAETLSVGITLEQPKNTIKAVFTDAKYYLDSLGMITDAASLTENLVLFAGKSWGQWGGAPHALNALSMVPNLSVFEPTTQAELTACMEMSQDNPKRTHVFSVVDDVLGELPSDCSQEPEGASWLVPQNTSDCLIISFGYASHLVAEANRDFGIPHLHCMALQPKFSHETLGRILKARRILTVEYNQAHGGFGSFIKSHYRIPAETLAVQNVLAYPCSSSEQKRRHLFDTESLKHRLLRFHSCTELAVQG